VTSEKQSVAGRWLNRTTLGVGLTSLFSDWSHEIATTVLPTFLASLGAGPGWLGIIEGVSDGLSSVAKLAAGHFTDRMARRKPLVLAGYAVTTVATGALGLTTRAVQALAARATAWLGRGARTPGRKALLAAAVSPDAYGRAFGFERMMDTLGAIVGPLTALWLLQQASQNYRRVFLWTLLPGMLAVACFGLLVRERVAGAPARISFVRGLRGLPVRFRWFLLAVGVFGLGDFAHSLLILYAVRALSPAWGVAAATRIAIGLYLLHNTFYAAFAYLGGWLGDRTARRPAVLAGGYAIASVMAAILVSGTRNLVLSGVAFALGGSFLGVEEALEDSIAAEIVPPAQHGMAFGTLAGVNAIGDFASSLAVGLLWSTASASMAFGLAGILSAAGAVLVLGSWPTGQRLKAGGT
jgi:MFS family permease